MVDTKRTVLITGCSEGGMGAALAIAFQEAGLHVYATARNLSKMRNLERPGIELLELDVLSAESIAACASKIFVLDILVNNAGASYSMPLSDVDLNDAKQLFEINVWSCLAVAQAFLPLLIKSRGMIINHTSVVGVTAAPFQAVYNASKAAIAMLSDCQRLELAPFGIKVLDLKTGAVTTNLIKNQKASTPMSLPKGSIYAPAREAVESAMRFEKMADVGMPADQWAKAVVADVLKNNPPRIIWRGANAMLVWFSTFFPHGMMDSTIKKMTGLDVVEQKLRAADRT